MEFAMTKVYVKFYISQILNAASYQEVKNNHDMLEQFLEENLDHNTQTDKCSSNNTSSYTTPYKSAKKEYDNAKYRRLFFYNGVYYSKVEIMGLVVETQIWGTSDDKYRYVLYIDDGSGIMQAIVWKNYNKGIYEKVQNNIVNIV
jgi:hypothetical protein